MLLLLLQLTKSLFGTGKFVILDIGLFVLKCIVSLKKRGVYASSLIKKIRCWIKYIDGGGIQSSMNNKQVGYQARLTEEVDGVGLLFIQISQQKTHINQKLHGRRST